MSSLKKILYFIFRRDTVPWLLLITLTALLALFAAISLPAPQAVPADANETDSVYYSSNQEASQESGSSISINSRNVKNYVICIRSDTIAIYEDGNTQPLYTIDTPPTRLPETDRKLLEAGIRTDSLSAAYKLIEDYE